MNNKDMAEFAENLWRNYIEPKMEASMTGDISYYRASVISNNGDGTLTIKPACDNERTANCTMEMSDVTAGSAVLVMRMGNGNAAENHLVFARTNAVNPILNMGGGFTPSGTISIVSNGAYDVTNYASADVSVPTGYTVDEIATKTISGTILGNGANVIKAHAFESYGYLTEAIFPACSLIEANVFAFCHSLTAVSFPVCTFIGTRAFSKCTSLAAANFPACTYISAYAFDSCHGMSAVSFPVCSFIGTSAFYKCYALTEASFPECTIISSYAFDECTALKSLSFPLCTAIGSSAFRGCHTLSTARFPKCTSLESFALARCAALTEVYFPMCERIVGYTFYQCSALTKAFFPTCVTVDGPAFIDCVALSGVDFSACTYIGPNAFSGCHSLSTALLPLCSYIGNSAFRYCYNLVHLYLTSVTAVTSLRVSVFYSTPIGGYSDVVGRYGSVYVPSSLYDQFIVATNWASISSRIVAV